MLLEEPCPLGLGAARGHSCVKHQLSRPAEIALLSFVFLFFFSQVPWNLFTGKPLFFGGLCGLDRFQQNYVLDIFLKKKGNCLPIQCTIQTCGQRRWLCSCKKCWWFREAGRQIPGRSPSGLSECKCELSSKVRTSSTVAPPCLACDL